MLCPNCKDTQLVMSERQGIEIDYCQQCRGVWLDRGELDKIIEKSTLQEQVTQQAHPNRDQQKHYDDRSDHYQKPYRKKSFWHELFD